ncbi:HdeD family acid-resistance protein [Paramicrobacterium agarici]|uniref:Uncharacterized membrane protein HdeD (DUF308 family) n=1 Tax=Paramicrobacterium agarici TaxID=630514 RepID=A0A2A9DX95_9MICO|nr:DUF308 domain-containing protein [Microbacterium agarici]PFG31417.1 uncharacterized membrane protein HdeD (DUF308 family) [Microbacterium agarici]
MNGRGTTWLIDHVALSPGQVKGVRAALIVGGLAAVVLGIVIWAWPGVTLLLVAWAFGVFFIVAGIARAGLGLAAFDETTGGKILAVILGIFLVIAGIVVLINPGFGVALLATMVGFVWIVEGAASLASLPTSSLKWLAIVYGVLSIVGGVFVILSPNFAAGVMLIFAATMLVVGGIAQTLEGIVFARGRDKPVTAGAYSD